MDTLSFMTEEQVRRIQREFGTPVFVYSEEMLERRAREILAFPNVYGMTARFAMKALPSAAVLRLFHGMGLHIDASSGFEARRAMLAGIPAADIQLTAQEIPGDLEELVRAGVRYNACSILQLRHYGTLFPGTEVSIRVNPGLGSGSTNRTNVGGPASSFGIWHEYLDAALAAAAENGVRIARMHTHIGSGSDPEVWVHCAKLSLGIVTQLPDVTTLSLGGGYKVARMSTEKSADIQDIGGRIALEFETFAQRHGRELRLEVEPGTYLAANAGAIVATACDVVDTGASGYCFIKTDSGMTDNPRPGMYGAQHPIITVPATPEERGVRDYIVVGHCCESGDILTPAPGDPEDLLPRTLVETKPGDAVVIEGSGAYCAAMASKNYNSFPESAEVMVGKDGAFRLIRKRQTLEQIVQNEILS